MNILQQSSKAQDRSLGTWYVQIESGGVKLPRFQRESMVFSPGEYVHQSFKAEFFDSLCGQCHGSISGRAVDVALKPDFVTQASATLSRDKPPFVLNKPPGERGAIQGPPASP